MPPQSNPSELILELLAKRGITDGSDIETFLKPDYEIHTHDPYLLADMKRAVERVLASFEQQERIAIYADFDCDGIPGAALLSDMFERIGYKNFETYIPHRDREGYGFHIGAIDALAARGVKLIITVDVGTVAVEGCAHAQSLGIDVIVTDHHEVLGELPDAYAVVNPKRELYPYPHLCGTGVAFKLACALLAKFPSVQKGWEKWLLDLVAIATVADMVPLTGENRVLTYWGLRVLRKSQRPGIIALCNKLRLRKHELTEDDIGFSIAPRINAASRMDDPGLAFRLLTTKNPTEADRLAVQLEELNASRKGIVSSIVKSARIRVAQRFTPDESLIVLGDTSWKPALLGLVANSLVGDRGGAVCVWGRDGAGNLKGSCRSDGSINLGELFTAARDAFIECGGHAASGGFSVSHEQIHVLQEKLSRVVTQKTTIAVQRGAAPDMQLSLSMVGWPMFTNLSRLAPFGIENQKPVVRIGTVRIDSVRMFGKEKNHIELSVKCTTTGVVVRAFDFFKSADAFTRPARKGDTVDLLATIERDAFRGATTIALRLIDIIEVSLT